MTVFRYLLLFLVIPAVVSAQPARSTLYTNGRHLFTPCGDTVILRGVNKMVIWTDDLALRKATYAEIRKTGANCVRIVWLAHPTVEADSGPDGLDRTIQDCINADMIPMVEVHDATGDWSKLGDMVDYWLRPDVLAVITKHQKYLLLNIANEAGDDQVTLDMFTAGYGGAITRLRDAGITAPLVIDASDWGKDIDMLMNAGPSLVQADPEHNLLFSVHMYWAVSDGADANYITTKLQTSANMGLPLIVGEFSYKFNRGGPCDLVTDYQTIVKVCQEQKIGWLAWEWGPGNEFADPTCDIMNMTTDSRYSTLKNGWPLELALSGPYAIAQTSRTPDYIINGGVCAPTGVETAQRPGPFDVRIHPNPLASSGIVELRLTRDASIDASLYDEQGRFVSRVASGRYAAGLHTFTLDGGVPQSGGLYFLRVSDGASAVVTHVSVAR